MICLHLGHHCLGSPLAITRHFSSSRLFYVVEGFVVRRLSTGFRHSHSVRCWHEHGVNRYFDRRCRDVGNRQIRCAGRLQSLAIEGAALVGGGDPYQRCDILERYGLDHNLSKALTAPSKTSNSNT